MRNFTPDEHTCKCGCGQNFMHPKHMEMLDDARDMAGIPFKITSGCRCKAHNKAEGGSPTSSHPKGFASDIEAITDEQRYKIVRSLLIAGFRRIGIKKTFIHVDNDPDKNERRLWQWL